MQTRRRSSHFFTISFSIYFSISSPFVFHFSSVYFLFYFIYQLDALLQQPFSVSSPFGYFSTHLFTPYNFTTVPNLDMTENKPTTTKTPPAPSQTSASAQQPTLERAHTIPERIQVATDPIRDPPGPIPGIPTYKQGKLYYIPFRVPQETPTHPPYVPSWAQSEDDQDHVPVVQLLERQLLRVTNILAQARDRYYETPVKDRSERQLLDLQNLQQEADLAVYQIAQQKYYDLWSTVRYPEPPRWLFSNKHRA